MAFRRPRGSLTDPVQAGWVLERAAKDLAAAYAHRYGVGMSEFMQLVIEHLVIDEDGSVRMNPLPPRTDEELPIEAR